MAGLRWGSSSGAAAAAQHLVGSRASWWGMRVVERSTLRVQQQQQQQQRQVSGAVAAEQRRGVSRAGVTARTSGRSHSCPLPPPPLVPRSLCRSGMRTQRCVLLVPWEVRFVWCSCSMTGLRG